jgi:hypothetical protein
VRKKSNEILLVVGEGSTAYVFVIVKVDKTLMTKKRVRLIKVNKIDVLGRLEIKIESRWTTIKEITESPLSSKNYSQMMSKLTKSVC